MSGHFPQTVDTNWSKDESALSSMQNLCIHTLLFLSYYFLFSAQSKKFFAFFIVSEFAISGSSKMQMPSGFSGIFDFLWKSLQNHKIAIVRKIFENLFYNWSMQY